MSSFTSFLLLLCATALFYFTHFTIAGSNETDRLALLEIKAKITKDPLGVTSSWNESNSFCEWHGVSCGRRHKRVTSLDLQSLKLTGSLSPWIGNLSFLKGLQLQNNSFSGIIPSEITHLHRLEKLLIFNNSFGGEIPINISNCSSLTQMHFYGNLLIGNIPDSIGKLTNLLLLSLSENNLTGTLPSSLGNLSSLVRFSIGRTNLAGRIPSSLGRLNNLKSVLLPANNLEGVVPPSLFNLSTLEKLDIGFNNLEGIIPSNMGNTLPNLFYFSIYDNNYTGHIPASISNASNLQNLQLSQNNLQGQVPSLHKLQSLQVLNLDNNFLGTGQNKDLDFVSSLSNATMLFQIDISGNNFGGTFPRKFCNLTKLSFLNIGTNKIHGHIPNCIGDVVYLQIFDTRENELLGVIPPNIGNLRNLYNLHFGDNRLSGNIPSSIGNLTLLSYFLSYENNLQGHIPSALGKCIYLTGLDLSQNYFSRSIPSELVSLPALSYFLDLSSNRLTGSLPPEVGRLSSLVTLDISNNKLEGEIPSTLRSCVQLTSLDMSDNSFQGDIPHALAALKSLFTLNLSGNSFSGKIPEFLQNLPLQNLYLDNNQLEGEVPTGGVFNFPNNVSVTGNKRLCGGIPELKLPPCASSQIRRPHHLRKLIVGLVSGISGILFVVALFLLLYHFVHRKKTEKPFYSNDSENFPNISHQMLVKATNGFSEENLIGSGTFGVVYKGILDDESIVAIKIFKLEFRGASKSFMAECGVLRNIRHRNLIKVITACSSVDYQGKDFKALVYEYMPNGSLEDWLHPKGDTKRKLNLQQRFDIVVDIAFALEYLHYHCGASIVHCDLKPSNILLSGDMVAQVSDFGLAKFLPQGITNSQDNQSSSVGIRGTIGYTPPEYGLGNEVSTNGDVYSFGILLVEIFTAKRPTDDMFKGGQSLYGFVNEALPKHVHKVIDHDILEDMDGEEIDNSVKLEAMVSVLGVALSCSNEVPQDRLNMSDAALKLSSIRNKLLETQQRK